MRLALSAEDRRISISVEAAAVGLLGLFVAVFVLDTTGLSVPVLRPALAFCLLTFVPGALVLTLVGFGPRAELRWGLYVVGVSLLMILTAGLVTNLVYPRFGIMRPLSPAPLAVTYGAVVVGLAAAVRRIDPPRAALSIPLSVEATPMPFALLSLPLLCVLAVRYLSVTNDNVPVLLVLGAIAVLPLSVVTGAIRTRWHALCVWALSIALLYHKTLWWFYEFSGQGNIIAAWKLGRWTPAAEAQTATVTPLLPNAMFSSTYAHLGGLGIFTQIEVVNPLLVSLIPLCAFVTFRRYIGSRDAFVGACVLAFIHPFYYQLPAGGRAATPVLFLAFCGLALTDSRLTPLVKRPLWLGFTAGYVVSHYGGAYLLLLAAAVAVALLALLDWVDALSIPGGRPVVSDGGTDRFDGIRDGRVVCAFRRVVRERWLRLFGVAVLAGAAFAVTTAGGVWVALHAAVVQPLGVGPIPYLGEWLGMSRTLAIVAVATALTVVTFAGTLMYSLWASLANDFEWGRTDTGTTDGTATGERLLSPSYVVLYTAMTLGWYMYTFGGRKLDILYEHVVNALIDLYTGSGSTGGTANRLAKDYGATSIQVSKYLYVVIAGLMFVGLLAVFHQRLLTRESEFGDEFLALSTALLGGFGLSLFMAGSWGGGRPMAITFCLTGVFVPLGARTLYRTATTVVTAVGRRFEFPHDGRDFAFLREGGRFDFLRGSDAALPVGRLGIATLLAVLLVVNTGVGAAVAFGGTAPSNVPLQEKFTTSEDPYARAEAYRELNVAMYVWLVEHRDPSLSIYGDWLTVIQYNQWYRPQVTATVDGSQPYGSIQYRNTLSRMNGPDDLPGYVMLGEHNTALGVIAAKRDTTPLATVRPELAARDKIFTTGHSAVYLAEE